MSHATLVLPGGLGHVPDGDCRKARVVTVKRRLRAAQHFVVLDPDYHPVKIPCASPEEGIAFLAVIRLWLMESRPSGTRILDSDDVLRRLRMGQAPWSIIPPLPVETRTAR